MDYYSADHYHNQHHHHHHHYHHYHQGSDPWAQTVYQHRYQGIDLPAQPQPFYNHTEDYYSYAYLNPQLVNTQPYPFYVVNAKPPPHGQLEPNPPGVAVLPPPQHDPNASYLSLDYCATSYSAALQQGGLDSWLAMVHQPIVQSSYNFIGSMNGAAHSGIAQTHPAPIPSFSAHPYSSHGRGRGRSLHKRQDRTVFTQVGPSQPRPQSYEPSLVPMPVPLTSQAQSAPLLKHMCELCKVECDNLKILNQHNSGKKHKKKLKSFEESQKMSTLEPRQILASAIQQLPQESSLPSQHINEAEKLKVEEAKSTWCELCKVECSNLEILNQHNSGKKHKKKLKSFEESQKMSTLEPRQILASAIQQLPQESSLPSQHINEAEKQKVEEAESTWCKLCKVECSNLKILNQHNSGKKHKKILKSFEESQKMSTLEPRQNLASAIQQLPQESSLPSQHINGAEKRNVEEAKSLWCEICKFKCSNLEILNQHNSGKKHKKKLKSFEESQKMSTPEPRQNWASAIQQFPQESSLPSQHINEAEKRKVEEAKSSCELCMFECSNLEILNQHNSGKKHKKKLKSFEESQKMSTLEPIQMLASAIQQLPQESSLPSQNINEAEKRKVEEAKSMWCVICKAYCSTFEIFNSHMNGNKHQKKFKMFENFYKSQIDAQTEQRVSGPELKPEVPSQPEQESLPSLQRNEESKVAVEKQQGEASGMESTEQAGGEVKACGSKRKMRGGKVSRSVRSKGPVEPPQPKEAIPLLCELCNINFESQAVFQSHIMGKQHFLKAKRFLNENETLGQEVFQILKQVIQTLHEQSVNASPTSIMTSQLDHHHQELLLSQMDLQAPVLEPNFESACVEDVSELLLLPTESDCPTGHLVSSETT